MTNFTDDPEKIGRNKNRRKSRNMADAGNKAHSTRNQRRKIRKTRQGMRTQQPPQRCSYLT